LTTHNNSQETYTHLPSGFESVTQQASDRRLTPFTSWLLGLATSLVFLVYVQWEFLMAVDVWLCKANMMFKSH